MGERPLIGKLLTMRRRRATLFCLLLWMAAAADASLFRRKRNAAAGGDQEKLRQFGSGAKGKGKRGKVKDDVAWLLEDTSDGGWKPVRDDGHVQVWKRSMPNSDFVAIKSKASLEVSPEALFEVLTPGDIEIVRQYNPLVEDGNDLEVMDRDNKVSWSATMGIWPCRPRDFVTHIQRATLEDGSVAIVNSATTHSKAPTKSNYVRGEILHGVFHIKAGKNKKHSEFTMVHHFNPGGNIPPWLINWLAEGKPLTFVRKLEQVAAKWDKQAALSKSMPCKGRGFDGGEQGDPSISGGSPMDASSWGAPLTAFTTALGLMLYGWRVFAGWSAILGEKEKSSSTLTGESKVLKEKSSTLFVGDVAHPSPAGQEKAVPPPPKESAPGSKQEMGVKAVARNEDVDGKGVVQDLNPADTQKLEGYTEGAENGKVPTAEGNLAVTCSVELTCGAFAAENNAEPPPVAAAVVEAAGGELPEKKENSVRTDETALAGRLEPESSPVDGKVCDGEFNELDVTASSEVDGQVGSDDVIVGDAVVEAMHDEVTPAEGKGLEEVCGGGQTTAGETNNTEAGNGVPAAKNASNGERHSEEMQRGQATDEGVRPMALVPQTAF